MHAEVVTALDVHLAELQRLRLRLTAARTIEPGERLDVVSQVAASAERFAHAVRVHHLAPDLTTSLTAGRQPAPSTPWRQPAGPISVNIPGVPCQYCAGHGR